LDIEEIASIAVDCGFKIDKGFRADIIVEGKLLIELKSVERLAAVHGKQVLTYLRLTNLPVGLLMNFGGEMFKDGVRRIANNYEEGSAKTLRIHTVPITSRS
jgi:GxxExxY protein